MHYLFSALLFYISETIGIGYITLLIYLIRYLNNPEIDIWYGMMLSGLFGACMFLQVILKNNYMIHGAMMAIRIRKCMVGAMYDKIINLSMKSLSETNSGKLITIVSGELAGLERPMCISGSMIAAPFLNLTA